MSESLVQHNMAEQVTATKDLTLMMKRREGDLRKAAEESRARAELHRKQALAAQESANKAHNSLVLGGIEMIESMENVPPKKSVPKTTKVASTTVSVSTAAREKHTKERPATTPRSSSKGVGKVKSQSSATRQIGYPTSGPIAVIAPKPTKKKTVSSTTAAVPPKPRPVRPQQPVVAEPPEMHFHVTPADDPTKDKEIFQRLSDMERNNEMLRDQLDVLVRSEDDDRIRRLEDDNYTLREQIGVLLKCHPLITKQDLPPKPQKIQSPSPLPPAPSPLPPAPSPLPPAPSISIPAYSQISMSPPIRYGIVTPPSMDPFQSLKGRSSQKIEQSSSQHIQQSSIASQTTPANVPGMAPPSSEPPKPAKKEEFRPTVPSIILSIAVGTVVECEARSRDTIISLAFWTQKAIVSSFKTTAKGLYRLEREASNAEDAIKRLEYAVRQTADYNHQALDRERDMLGVQHSLQMKVQQQQQQILNTQSASPPPPPPHSPPQSSRNKPSGGYVYYCCSYIRLSLRRVYIILVHFTTDRTIKQINKKQ